MGNGNSSVQGGIQKADTKSYLLGTKMQSQSSVIASAISLMLQSHRGNSGWRPLNSPNCCNHGDVLSISLAVKLLFQQWGPGLDT